MTAGRRDSRHWDEDDVRVRPSRGKSRPRSKERPRHTDAEHAFVTSVDRGRFGLRSDDGRELAAVKARELGRKGVVVGDSIQFIPGPTDEDLARIVRLDPRRTTLRRTADDTDPVERVIVANADQLAVVTSITDPEPRPRLIDRALVAAFEAGLTPLLIVTKCDLADPTELLAAYAALDVEVITVSRDIKAPRSQDVLRIHAALHDHVTVLVGHSGVGKSTLVNALVPGAARATGSVNEVTGRGRHTSTSAVALALPEGGWIIDTPGVRSFGLAHVSPDAVVRSFEDLAGGIDNCPRGCTHDETECALDDFVGDDTHARARLDSLRRLLASR